MLKTFSLKNGTRVASYNLPQLRSVFILALVLGGSLEEDHTKSGLAHFMEHMLVQGTPSLPTAEEFSQFVESLSGNYGATTSLLQVSFTIALPKSHIEDALQITSEVLYKPLFPEQALEKERQAVFDEITQRMDSHYFKIAEFFKQKRYKKGSSLRLNEGGTIETVGQITRDDLIEYWKKYFVPANTYLVIVGSFDEKKVKLYLDQYFNLAKGKAKQKLFTIKKDVFSPRGVFLRHDENLKINYLDITFPSISLEASLKDRIAQHILTVILGGLRNSRLFKLLRYQLGLVYGISCGSTIIPGCGYGYINVQSLPEKTDQVLELVVQELSAYVKNGPLETELEFAKNYLSNQWLMAFDHPSSIAGWLENDLLWHEKVMLPEEYIELIKDISAKYLVNFMQKNWDFSKLQLLIQGQVKDNKANQKKYNSKIAPLSN